MTKLIFNNPVISGITFIIREIFRFLLLAISAGDSAVSYCLCVLSTYSLCYSLCFILLISRKFDFILTLTMSTDLNSISQSNSFTAV